MLHRVLLGSLERFIGALLEHYKGVLPLWLAPTQVVIIPIKDTLRQYSDKIKALLIENAIRVEVDDRNETLNKRIRSAEVNKVPYVLVLGDREEKEETVSVRKKGVKETSVISAQEFVKQIKEETERRS